MHPSILCLLVTSAFALPGTPVTAVAAPHTMPVSVPIVDPVLPVAGAGVVPKNSWWDRLGRWHPGPGRPQRPQQPPVVIVNPGPGRPNRPFGGGWGRPARPAGQGNWVWVQSGCCGGSWVLA